MNPILRDFPDRIESPRLIIRCPLPGDGAPLRAAVLASEPALRQWMPWAMDIPDEAGYEALVRQGRLRFLAREDLWLMLLLRESGAIVGGSGLHRIDWAVPRFEIGYWLQTAFTGQGLMTEAVTAITEFALTTLGARRLEIRCDALNERSAAVALRAGFSLEASLRQEARHHLTGRLRDTQIYTRLAQEPEP